MSPTLIRCLLAILALAETYEHVVSKDVAHLLGVKRPTVHRTLEVLKEEGCIDKKPYGDIRLTEVGEEKARKYQMWKEDLSIHFSRTYGIDSTESGKIAVAIMSELSDESVQNFCERAKML